MVNIILFKYALQTYCTIRTCAGFQVLCCNIGHFYIEVFHTADINTFKQVSLSSQHFKKFPGHLFLWVNYDKLNIMWIYSM